MRSVIVAALCCFAAGCRDRVVNIDIGSRLSVEPGELVFEPTVVGQTRALPLRLINGSRAPLSLHVSSPAPFALELDVQLAGADVRTVDVVFTPRAVESFSAALHVTGDLALEAALTGEGLAASVCTNPSPCRRSTLDPVTNACAVANAPDGESCTSDNACITAGHCLAGVCIGSATSCDDSDVCTVDACDASGG
ncbi:MAG: hypothetical protein JNK82_13405, partial [Myxococcaceae bacterium]|nr:hypothetical protein [Myxococcaceae bacterium]